MSETNPTFSRLNEQIQWYDTKSQYNQRWYKRLKIVEIASGALITLGAGFQWSYGIIGSLGVLIILLEGVQNVCQLHHNWMSYRSTCEYLKKEQSLFFAKAGNGNPISKFLFTSKSLLRTAHIFVGKVPAKPLN